MKRKSFSVIILALLLTSSLNLVTLTRSIVNEDQLKDYEETKFGMKHSVQETSEGSDESWDIHQDPNMVGENQDDSCKTSDLPYIGVNTRDSKIRLIVGFTSNSEDTLKELKETAARHRGEVVNTVTMGQEVRAAAVELSWASATAFMEETTLAEWTRYVEPAMKFEAQIVPNDPYWGLQWGPQKIEADWAWNVTVGDPSVIVAVVDSGVDYTHEDLALNYMPGGYDWVNMDNDPMDDYGHGTHCAGIIAAVLDNLVGIAGLAQVRVLAEKVLNNYGGGYEDWVANGIINATDSGVDIISMSLGGYGDSVLVHDAVKYAHDAGVLVIAAAGNDDTNMKLYPAGYDEVVAVAATDQFDNKAYFSQWGEWIELAAPGVDIYSTVPGGYASKQGTSMACPHVTGLAALVWSRHPNKTRDWVRLWMRYTADDLGDPGHDIIYGYGRINARKAVAESPPTHELIAVDWTTPPYMEPGSSGSVSVTILNFGENNEANIMVELLANSTPVDSQVIGFLGSGNATTANLLWNPSVGGVYNLTVSVVPVPGESNLENNILWKFLYVGSPVKAVVLHSAGNLYSEIISMWQALNSEWHLFGDTMVYIDYVSLNVEDITYEDINETDADVLVISCASDPYAGWEFTDSEVEAIEQYVHEGHGLIATAGTFLLTVPNNNKLAPLFGLCDAEYWRAAYTDLLHVEDALHPVLIDVPDPFVFPRVEGAIPEDGEWSADELVGGEYIARGHFKESAIVTYKGLVYISPWLEILPPYYHHHMQLLYNALTWSSYKKPDHELIVGLEAPDYLEPGETTQLNATVCNRGLNNETNVELQLTIDGTTVNSTLLPQLLTGECHTISHQWTPTIEATYNITTYAPPVPNENITTNNKWTKIIEVRPIRGLVLFDQTHYTDNIEYFEIWVENLIDYGYIVETHTSGSITIDILEDYCAFVIPQAHDYYQPAELIAVQNYVLFGGGLVVIGDDAPTIYTELTSFAGIAWTSGGDGGYISDITPHPVTEGVHTVYFSSPVSEMHVTSPAVDLIRDYYGGVMLATSEVSTGKVIGIADENSIDDSYIENADNLRLATNMIEWVCAPPPEHDLVTFLEAPDYLEPGETTQLNATVCNRGLNNETNVELQLTIDGTTVNSTLLPQLLTGECHTISHQWTPTIEATYNITTYAPPVPNENYTTNNVYSRYVIVSFAPKILAYVQYTDYDQEYANALIAIDSTFGPNYLLTELLDNTQLDSMLPGNDVLFIPEQEYADLYMMESIGATWSTTLSNFLNEGGVIIICDYGGGSYGILTGAGLMSISGSNYITGSTVYLVDPSDPLAEGVSSTFIAPNGAKSFITAETNVVFTDGMYPVVIHKTFGLGEIALLGFDYFESNPDVDQILGNAVGLCIRYEHEITVSLEAPNYLEPGETTQLNATVCNRGLNNETNVELQLTIDGTTVNSTLLPQLLTGECHTISHQWTPTIEATYNITTYAPPVPNENYTTNNLVTRMVHARYVAVALISDYWDLVAITPILDSMGIGYDIYNENHIHLYTEDLDLLLSYGVVIFYKDYRHITVDEYTALESYGSSGGSLLVTGFDSMVSDDLLRDIIRSSTMGDNVGEPDLYVVDETHPIMDGPYGSFPAGYHISGLSSDCDTIEADTARMAVTVAELADGYDKVIATDGLPGKVVYWNGVGPNDWMWNVDCEAIFKNTLTWFLTQHEHELAVRLDAPTFLEPGESSLLKATVQNRGLNNETMVDLSLFIDGTTVNSTTIPELPIGEAYTINYLWTPTIEATYNITAYAPPVPGENFTGNNRYTKFTMVMYAVRIGIIETHGETLHNEELADYYRSLGHIVEKIITTITLGVLSDYDIIIVGESGSGWLPSEISAMEAYVDSGGGFVSVGDQSSTSVQAILSTYGISYTGTSASGGSSSYFDPLHPIMRNVSLIYASAPIDTLQIQAPAYWIANDVSDTYILIAGTEVGGYVLCLSDDFAADCYDDDNEVMFKNIVEWMTGKYEHELVVSLEAPPFLMPSNSSLLKATVQNNGVNNETMVDLSLFIDGTTVNSTTIPMLPIGEAYTINYLWTPTIEATYNITAYAPPVPNENYTENNIVMKDVLVSSVLPTTYISVNPALTTVAIGEEFTVTIDIVNVENLYGLDVTLAWDPAILAHTGHEITMPKDDFPDGILWGGILVVVDIVDDTGGTYQLAAVTFGLPPPPSFNGSGTAFKIAFTALSAGVSPLEIISSKLAGRPVPPDLSQPIEHDIINGVVQVTGSTPTLHDVAILNVTTSRNATYPGHPVNITVTAANLGNSPEDFNVTVYYGNTTIDTQSVAHLPPALHSIVTLTFTWNTTGLEPCNTHTIWAEAHPVPFETNTTNNIFYDGQVKIKLLGDLDGDDTIDLLDVVTAALAYGARRGDPRWNPEADLAPLYGLVDIFDIVTITYIFGACP